MFISSLRKVEFTRSTLDWDCMRELGIDTCVAARCSQVKNTLELDARWVIPRTGFFGELEWMTEHLALIESMGGNFIPIMKHNVPDMHKKKACFIADDGRTDREGTWEKIIYKLYDYCGMNNISRKEHHLAVHGFHELFDTIAAALLWSPEGRTEMGRWVFEVDDHGRKHATKGEAKVIYARYASPVSCNHQIKMRRNIMLAVKEIVLNNTDWKCMDWDSTLKCIVNSEHLAESEYYGPKGHK